MAKAGGRFIGAAPLGPLLGAALAFASCGGDGPWRLAGETTHFRLFVGQGVDLPSATGLEAADLLAALETNRADTATLLGTPEGRIDYHLSTATDVAGRCGGHDVAGCQVGLSVYTTRAVDQHELNHAYMALRTSHEPAPLVLEGMADAVGCGEGGTAAPPFSGAADWRDVIAYASYAEVYGPGRLLVRHLILTGGVEAVLRYYQQAPDTRDPTTFAENFAAFWSQDLDSVWAEMQRAQPAWGPETALPICPCSLPSWTAASAPAMLARAPEHPYWTWPALNGDTAAWSGNVGAVSVSDCARHDFAVAGFGALLARIEDPPLDGHLYSNVSAAAVARGRFLADDCASAAPYGLPSSLLASASGIEVKLAATRAAANTTATTALYLALDAPEAIGLSATTTTATFTACPSCDFTDPRCAPLPQAPASTPVSGRVYLRWDAPATPWPYAMAGLRVAAP